MHVESSTPYAEPKLWEALSEIQLASQIKSVAPQLCFHLNGCTAQGRPVFKLDGYCMPKVTNHLMALPIVAAGSWASSISPMTLTAVKPRSGRVLPDSLNL